MNSYIHPKTLTPPARGGRRREIRTRSRTSRNPAKTQKKTFCNGLPNFSGTAREKKAAHTAQWHAAFAPRAQTRRVEVTSPRLYVGNLSFDATESDLFRVVNGVGHVQNAEV